MGDEGNAWKKVSGWAGSSIGESDFHTWVQRKARALWKRDKRKRLRQCIKEGNNKAMRETYCQAIYKAIAEMEENKCPYTGEALRWDLIGQWNNADAEKGGKTYKKKFENLPTVDHKNAEPVPDFVICSWVANDAKNDLSYDDFVNLCEAVCNYKKTKSGPSGL